MLVSLLSTDPFIIEPAKPEEIIIVVDTPLVYPNHTYTKRMNAVGRGSVADEHLYYKLL
jgi:hypothetical protein